jgi:hypothetical protein
MPLKQVKALADQSVHEIPRNTDERVSTIWLLVDAMRWGSGPLCAPCSCSNDQCLYVFFAVRCPNSL